MAFPSSSACRAVSCSSAAQVRLLLTLGPTGRHPWEPDYAWPAGCNWALSSVAFVKQFGGPVPYWYLRTAGQHDCLIFSPNLVENVTPHSLEIIQHLQFLTAEVNFHFDCPWRWTQAVFPPVQASDGHWQSSVDSMGQGPPESVILWVFLHSCVLCPG